MTGEAQTASHELQITDVPFVSFSTPEDEQIYSSDALYDDVNRTPNTPDQMSSKSSPTQSIKKRKHICGVCLREFPKAYNLKRHEITHGMEKPFKCDLCHKGFVELGHLKMHQRIHTGFKPFTCDVCAKTFCTLGTLNAHKRYHPKHRMNALLSAVISNVLDGANTDNMKDNDDVLCSPLSNQSYDVSETFSNTGDMAGTQQKGDDAETQNTPDNISKKSKTTGKSSKTLNCPVCQQEFRKLSNLKIHQITHTDLRPHSCEICSQSFSSVSHLNSHKLRHTGVRPFVCEICSKAFYTASNLRKHNRTHTKQKLYVCGECDKRFTEQGHLKVHMRVHTGDRPYVCHICEKGFTTSSNLSVHMRVHSGTRPYVCHVCTKAFTESCHLVRHKKTRHPNVEDVPTSSYECIQQTNALYNVVFGSLVHDGENADNTKDISLLLSPSDHPGQTVNEREMDGHTEAENTPEPISSNSQRKPSLKKTYSCPVCQKEFFRLYHMKRHRLSHVIQKPYDCTVCRKSFSEQSRLNEHSRVHTGEKPFTCKVCAKVFASSSNLNVHRRSHRNAGDVASLSDDDSQQTVTAESQETTDHPQDADVSLDQHGTSEGDVSSASDEHKQETNALSSAWISNVLEGENTDDMKDNVADLCSSLFRYINDVAGDTFSNADETARVQQSAYDTETQNTPDQISSTSKTPPSGKKAFICNVCQKEFPKAYNLKRHKLTHGYERPYKCEICQKGFVELCDMKVHQRVHLNKTAKRQVQKADCPLVAYKTPEDHVPSGSDECKLQMDAVSASGTETRHQQDQMCNTSDATQKKRHCCYLCLKGFTKISHLKTHLLSHSSERAYNCPVCDLGVIDRHTLKRHLRTHSGEKPFVCEICAKTFSLSSNLKKHIRTHTDHKPFVCGVCQKRVTNLRSLQDHMRIHTGERPCVCQVCSCTFRKNSQLARHMYTHTNVKPYSCKVCQKAFVEPNHLREHERIHTGEKPYYCSICSKAFRCHSHLGRHRKIHFNLKPYTCEECQRSFTQLSALKAHYRTHTGERPYECDICTKTFASSTSLILHKQSHVSL